MNLVCQNHPGMRATVHKTITWTNTREDSTKEIYESLAKACRGPLESQSSRTYIMESIESKVEHELRERSRIRDLLANWHPALTF